MDNLTHTLVALTLARTSMGRGGRGTTAALVLASNAPDIDIVAAFGGTAEYLHWHRGPTHGPLGLVALAAVVAGLVHLALRTRRFRSAPPGSSNAPLAMLFGVSLVGVLCHVLMDFPTSYGSRLFSPFDWHWFAADWMPIVDIYLLAALAAGLIFGSESAAARRRNVAIVFMLMALNYGVRAVAHDRALANAPRLFGPLFPQPCDPDAPARGHAVDSWPRTVAMHPRDPSKRCLVQVAALPTFLSPFHWRVVAQLSNAYEIHDINLLDRRFWSPPAGPEVLWRTTVRVPNVWTPVVWTASSTRLARIFLGFGRLTAVRTTVDQAGVTTVWWSDLRFVGTRTAPGPPQRDTFTVFVRVGPDGRVLDEQLGP